MTRENREQVLPEPKPGEWLSPEDFASVVRLTPLVSIDIVVRGPDRRVLLGCRTSEPAKGVYFVPGGRITKNETRAAAFRRLTKAELGVARDITEARFLGVYDHLYPTNRLELPGFGTHYVVLGYEIELNLETGMLPHDQHGHYAWREEQEILTATDVHPNTQAYFQNPKGVSPHY
jgi:colanic acid biosynthesis protein WcaH